MVEFVIKGQFAPRTPGTRELPTLALLVAIEGIDGSGKGTQAQQLYRRLLEAEVPSQLFSFPRYDHTLFGKAVGDYLNGRFGQLHEISPFLVSLLYAGDRFESRQVLLDAMTANEIVVCDRYVPSNVAHQGAKSKSSELAELVDWIETIEYDIFQLPRPDAVVLLDLPVDASQELVLRKQARSYTNKAADLHEKDGAYLQQVRAVYQHLAANESGWHAIDCWQDGELRSIDRIGQDVWEVLKAVRANH